MFCNCSIMLIYLAIFILSSAVLAISTDRIDIVYPSIETSRSGEKIIKFRALDQNVYLRLEPAGDVIANDFTMVNGANKEIQDSINITSIKRKLYIDEKMGATLYIDDEGPLIINGMINSQLSIEPHQPEKLSKDGRIAHRITKMQKHENDYLIDGNLNDDFNGNLNRRKRQLTNNDCIRIEVAFITDSNFTERFNSSFELLTYLANMLNKIELKFRSLDLGIKFVFLGVMKITKENETTEAPYIADSFTSKYPGGVDAYALFYGIPIYYIDTRISLLKRADIVLFMSGREFVSKNKYGEYEPGPIGLAFAGGICKELQKYSLIQDISDYSKQVYLIVVHEIGHLLGSGHDGDGPHPYIPNNPGAIECSSMSKLYIMFRYDSENATLFSQCSLENIKHFLKLERAKCVIENCQADENRIIARFLSCWISFRLFHIPYHTKELICLNNIKLEFNVKEEDDVYQYIQYLMKNKLNGLSENW